jgi:hypothetical protein
MATLTLERTGAASPMQVHLFITAPAAIQSDVCGDTKRCLQPRVAECATEGR